MVARLRAALHGMQDGGDSAIVWVSDDGRRVFISVGDWASPNKWVDAVTPLVGRDNIETTHEGGPDGGGWVIVRDYHRIKDNFSMTPERRLEVGLDYPVVEGMVAVDRKDITTIINKLAGRINRSAVVMFGRDRGLARSIGLSEPVVEYADDESQPAVVTVRLGGRAAESLAVMVHGDGKGEIKLEMSERLSRLLGLPRYAALSSLEEVQRAFGVVVATIRRKLGGAAGVNHHDRA
jgi:hypothetical protein